MKEVGTASSVGERLLDKQEVIGSIPMRSMEVHNN